MFIRRILIKSVLLLETRGIDPFEEDLRRDGSLNVNLFHFFFYFNILFELEDIKISDVKKMLTTYAKINLK